MSTEKMDAGMLRVTVLIDNVCDGQDRAMCFEHGLSFYIQTGSANILCDMGASEGYIANAIAMGINLVDADFAFVSHGHSDHTGGLGAFLASFPGKQIYLSSDVFGARYFSSRLGRKRDISTDRALQAEYPDRFVYVDASQWIDPNLAIVRNTCNGHSRPIGNATLTSIRGGVEEADDFRHELSLAFKTSRGLVVVSSCSHNGAINIMDSCCQFTGEKKVYAFIGGLHFVDGDCTVGEVNQFARELSSSYPDTLIYTGHCTGEIAKRELIRTLPNVSVFCTGSVIDL